jgi:hypothetical protein
LTSVTCADVHFAASLAAARPEYPAPRTTIFDVMTFEPDSPPIRDSQ